MHSSYYSRKFSSDCSLLNFFGDETDNFPLIFRASHIWNGFLKLVWYAGGATVITLILMAYFLV